MKRNWIVAALVAIAALVIVYQQIETRAKTAASMEGAAPKAGYRAPSLELAALGGETYRVGGKRDKPLLINFWASWCEPCQKEAPDLQAIYVKYEGRFDLYAVNLTSRDTQGEAEAMAKRFGFTFPILLDPDGAAEKRYEVRTIPTSYLIDSSGNVAEVLRVLDAGDLDAKLQGMIGGSINHDK
ncbi:MAG: TlpA family protein disulfide reductase [Paenibacillaceae bacterium]|nr:TlpA family protein disulfide reductase [Paenibacillaceae bacterium]